MEIVLLVWVLIAATLWLVRILAEEMWTAVRGGVSPRIARRRAREELAREYGTPTVGQALAFRLAHRIAHPPQRRWARQLRAVAAEFWEDALQEARVRHHVRRVERARRVRQRYAAAQRPPRGDGWTAHTGGSRPEPPPETPPADPPAEQPDAGAADLQPCIGCGSVYLVDGDRCDDCEHPPAPDDPDPGPPSDEQPAPTPSAGDDDNTTYPKETPMSATHVIDGDLRDPRQALAFATACRGLNDGVVRELDILAANMGRCGVGPRPIGDVRVLADAGRTYSRSAHQSVTEYAQHVTIQADIHGDEDLRDTVRDTYLDTRHGDAAPAPKGGSGTYTIRATDCTDPAAGAKFMAAVAETYKQLVVSVDQALGMHQRSGITGEPIEFLTEQHELAATMSRQAEKSAQSFRDHIRRRDDTVGKKASIHGTQSGKYLDPSRA